MRAGESYKQSNVGPGTYGPIFLTGGKYQFTLNCTGTPSAVLNKLGPDGVTYLPVGAALVLAGIATYDLPPGQYQVVISTSTANYFEVTRVPEE